MPAQFEEVIVAAHLLHLQQLAPEPGQGDFQRALGRLVGAADQVLGPRRRQRPAVQLAVAGQRPGVERYVGHGQHVLRQLLAQKFPQLQGRDRLARNEPGQQLAVPGLDQRLAHCRVIPPGGSRFPPSSMRRPRIFT